MSEDSTDIEQPPTPRERLSESAQSAISTASELAPTVCFKLKNNLPCGTSTCSFPVKLVYLLIATGIISIALIFSIVKLSVGTDSFNVYITILTACISFGAGLISPSPLNIHST